MVGTLQWKDFYAYSSSKFRHKFSGQVLGQGCWKDTMSKTLIISTRDLDILLNNRAEKLPAKPRTSTLSKSPVIEAGETEETFLAQNVCDKWQ